MVEKSVPVRLTVMGEQVFHLGPQGFVVAAGIAEPFPTLSGGHARGRVEQFADLAPALGFHRSLPPRSWPWSQARPSRQSRSTVATETPSAAATSGTVRPPK